MVFLDKNSEKTVINRHFNTDCVSLTIINNFSNQEYTFSDLVDVSDSSYFYEFALDLGDILDGEYTIRLFDEDDKLIEEMIGVCGNYQTSNTSYERQNNIRAVYERE